MPVHAFVDESQRGKLYVVVAAIAEPSMVAQLRKNMRSLLLPGQREIHCKREKPARRRVLADTIARWPIQISVYTRTYQRDPEPARQTCIDRLLQDLLQQRAGRLVLDSRAEQDRHDVQTIRSVLRHHHEPSRMTWEHTDSTGELLLAVPDVAGWCFGAGGEWRKRVEPIITDVIDLDSL